MSDADSFIEEVTEEVRRDRMFQLLKKYGWIGALGVVLIVGGAGLREYNKAKAQAAAEELGDKITASMQAPEAAARAEALGVIAAEGAGGAAVVKLLQAAALSESGDTEAAVALLNTVATDGGIEIIYRHTAAFKALALQAGSLSVQDRMLQYEALAAAGAPLRLLAEEQMALIEISEGQPEAAITRLSGLLQDAELTPDLRERAGQVIVALGGSLEQGAPAGG